MRPRGPRRCALSSAWRTSPRTSRSSRNSPCSNRTAEPALVSRRAPIRRVSLQDSSAPRRYTFGLREAQKTARLEPGGRSRYAWQDSNLRPLGPQPNALSPELQARLHQWYTNRVLARRGEPFGAGREGFEPSERFYHAQPLSRRPHSTTLAPPQADRSPAALRLGVDRNPSGKVYHDHGSDRRLAVVREPPPCVRPAPPG